ncbi:hypothetical protein Pint_14739 [Pistacia integerrima]|nr:hypothetical protein Pint_14739 [Pistacia integerrima]KAJ0090321.1 hypothetical protein Patl1_14875 [Pistacia atlantica]
MGLAQLI